jgi:hypothetical protein
LFIPWENFLSEIRGDIIGIWWNYIANLCPRLLSHITNISLLRKLAEDACKDAKLWASRSEGDDIVDVDFPLDEGDYSDEPTIAEHHQNYTALLQALRNAVRDSDVIRDSPVLQSLIRDLCQENLAEESRPFVQRHDGFYQQIRYRQDSILSRCPIPSVEDVQAAAKAQDILYLRMLNEMEGGVQGSTTSIGEADIDDLLVR